MNNHVSAIFRPILNSFYHPQIKLLPKLFTVTFTDEFGTKIVLSAEGYSSDLEVAKMEMNLPEWFKVEKISIRSQFVNKMEMEG